MSVQLSHHSSSKVQVIEHAGSPWHGLSIARYHLPPAEVSDWTGEYHMVDLNLNRSYHLEWKQNQQFRRTLMTPGSLCISPAREACSMRWHDSIEFLKVQIAPFWLLQTAQDLNLPGEIELPQSHGETDVQLGNLCRSLWAEASTGYPLGRAYGDSLATSVSSCLLRRYTKGKSQPGSCGRLTKSQWERLSDYIEANLEEELSLEVMASVVQFSPYHFSRCFKATVGTSPHQYIIVRRIERAHQLLKRAELPLAQIAIQCGFADQSHLTRHMKRRLGVTPAVLMAQYRSKKMSVC